ncbi:MAG: hypothetical protein LBT01_02665 [Spirochaetaceae bacterium]|jgi:hypothetical protein|nr:hypothetical protein [Spirochaetaceae bacterium]
MALTTFEDGDYYKNALEGGSDEAKRLNNVYQKYAAAKDEKDKAVFRQQIVGAYWDYCGIAAKSVSDGVSDEKKFLLRFGMLNPKALRPETKEFFANISADDVPDSSIRYLDEWFLAVGRGEASASTTDEVQTKKNDSAHTRALMEKAKGKLEGTKGILRNLNANRRELEFLFKPKADSLCEHRVDIDFNEINACYTEGQKNAALEIQDMIKNMSRVDREIAKLLETYKECTVEVASIESKLKELGEAEAVSFDLQSISTEFSSIRQMAKMTVGRQGNPFPFLNAEYFRCAPDGVGTRENVQKRLDWIESIDCEVFQRSYKNQVSRIAPFALLLPSYGDYGVCWEPFEKKNKLTSRGRIAIPMYPKNLTMAILAAVGDYRWQFMKEVSSFYWMEEGLTGNYYQWFLGQKLKGDVKLYFIQDYIAWITKEAEGTQKLDKEIRGIFWRYMPFAQDVKDKLKDRNLVYQELYQRDKNRTMSDGY